MKPSTLVAVISMLCLLGLPVYVFCQQGTFPDWLPLTSFGILGASHLLESFLKSMDL